VKVNGEQKYYKGLFMEIWKDIKDWEGLYQVSSYGNIRSLNYNHTKKMKKLKKTKDKNGYFKTILRSNGKNKDIRFGRAVAQAFISNPENKPEVNHLNGNKQCDFWWNLEWATSSENNKHAYKTGLKTQVGERNTQAKLKNKDIIFIRKNKDKYTRKKLGELFNVSQGNIKFIIENKTWTHIKI
jgi:hypothetical protein